MKKSDGYSDSPSELFVLPNGLQAAVEFIKAARSVSFQIRFNFGAKDDPPGRAGLAALAESTVLRGGEGWTARQILDALDDHGLDRDSSTSAECISFWATCLPQCLRPVLKIYGRILAQPFFPAREVKVARTQGKDALLHLEDNPMRKVIGLAYRAALGPRLGREPQGSRQTLPHITPNDARSFWHRFHSAQAAMVAIAGAVPLPDAVKILREAFGHWSTRSAARPARPFFLPRHAEKHCPRDLHQTHLCLVWPAPPLGHPLYDAGQLLATLLSGGSSSRLFTEIREKRGLAYTIHTFLRSWRSGSLLTLYVSTTPGRAGETLKVCKEQLNRLATLKRSELDRARMMAKGHLLTWGEISDARAAAMANEFFFTGRTRSLLEALQALDAVTLDDLRAYLDAFPPSPLTIVSLG